jgi:hypothetical protein
MGPQPQTFGSSWPGLSGSSRASAGCLVPAIALSKAKPRRDDQDHQDTPLRGGPVMLRAASKVIYGDARTGKGRAINKLLYR